jgi:hypothetical protein
MMLIINVKYNDKYIKLILQYVIKRVNLYKVSGIIVMIVTHMN